MLPVLINPHWPICWHAPFDIHIDLHQNLKICFAHYKHVLKIPWKINGIPISNVGGVTEKRWVSHVTILSNDKYHDLLFRSYTIEICNKVSVNFSTNSFQWNCWSNAINSYSLMTKSMFCYMGPTTLFGSKTNIRGAQRKHLMETFNKYFVKVSFNFFQWCRRSNG